MSAITLIKNQKITLSNYASLVFIMYARKSQDSEDRQIESIPDQIRELTELVQREGIKIYTTIEETQSAFSPGRPGWRKVINLIKEGKAQGILVWQSSRCSRNYQENGELQQLLADGVVRAIRTKDELYTRETDKQFMLSLNLAMDRQFSSKVSDGVIRGMKTKVLMKKEWGNKAKPGYLNKRSENAEKRWIEIDPDRFHIIQQSIKHILYDGYSPQEALEKLNGDYGYRTRLSKKLGGKPMGRSCWYKLLADPYYYGLIVYTIEGEKREVVGTHTPMISEDEYWLLQTKLGKYGRQRKKKQDGDNGGGSSEAGGSDNFHFPYKGILRCGECGGFVTAEEKIHRYCSLCGCKNTAKSATHCRKCGGDFSKMSNLKTKVYVYYHCTKKVNKNCSQGKINKNEIEDKIRSEIDRFTIDEDFMQWALKHLHELNEKEFALQETAKRNLRHNSDQIENEVKALVQLQIKAQMNGDGDVVVNEYTQTIKKKKVELELAQKEEKKAQDEASQWLELSKNTFEFACYGRYWFDHSDWIKQTWVLDKLGSNLTVKDGKMWIDGDRPWFLIEKAKQEVEKIKSEGRTTKNTAVSDDFYFLPAVSSSLCRL